MSDQDNYDDVKAEFETFSAYYDDYVLGKKTVQNSGLEYLAIDQLKQMMGQINIEDSTPHILDVATGTALLAQELKNQFPSSVITGTDLSEAMLKKAAQKQILDHSLCSDATQALPFRSHSFNMVASCGYFEFIPGKLKQSVDDLLRVVKPDGHIALAQIKTEELDLQDYLGSKGDVLAYKEATGYAHIQGDVKTETPYDYIIFKAPS